MAAYAQTYRQTTKAVPQAIACASIKSMSEKDEIRQSFNRMPESEDFAGAHFDLVADKKTGKVWILHDKPFRDQGRIDHIEYDAQERRLRLITKDGSSQYLGPAIGDLLHDYVVKTDEIAAFMVKQGGGFEQMFVTPLKHVKTGKPV